MAEVSTNRGQVFFEVIRWQFIRFQMIAGSRLLFLKFMSNMLCLCQYRPALLRFWFQTNLGRENLASYLKIQAGKKDAFHFSHHSLALVTLHVQFLCSDWSNFDRWVHAENLCNILELVYFHSWSWQSFVSTRDVFNCNFYKMKYSCYQESFGIHAPLVNVGNPISNGTVFVFHLAGCVREL